MGGRALQLTKNASRRKPSGAASRGQDKAKEIKMARCDECGREMRVGEGRQPIKYDWRKGRQLVCDKCYESQKGLISGLFFLALGTACGAFTASPVIQILTYFEQYLGLLTVRIIALVIAGIAIVAFVFTNKKSKRVSGCLARAFYKTLAFILICFILVLVFMTLSSGEFSLKQKCEEARAEREGKPVAVENSASIENETMEEAASVEMETMEEAAPVEMETMEESVK